VLEKRWPGINGKSQKEKEKVKEEKEGRKRKGTEIEKPASG